MTNEEAAEIVKFAFQMWESEYGGTNEDWSEEHKACEMAIAALRGQNVKVVAQVIIDTDKLQEICERAAQNIYNELRGEYGKIN